MDVLSKAIEEEIVVAQEQIDMTKPGDKGFDGRSYWLGRRDALIELRDEFQE